MLKKAEAGVAEVGEGAGAVREGAGEEVGAASGEVGEVVGVVREGAGAADGVVRVMAVAKSPKATSRRMKRFIFKRYVIITF